MTEKELGEWRLEQYRGMENCYPNYGSNLNAANAFTSIGSPPPSSEVDIKEAVAPAAVIPTIKQRCLLAWDWICYRS